MKKLLPLIILLFSTGAQAEKQVWACQLLAAAGLSWDGNSWDAVAFEDENFLIDIELESFMEDAERLKSDPPEGFSGDATVRASMALRRGLDQLSMMKIGGRDLPVRCEESYWAKHIIHCVNNVSYEFLVLNTETGLAGKTNLWGAVLGSSLSSIRDSVPIATFQCTKF